ncbi:MAG TPA: NAD-dependent succinate-semialdehyde dehydrogenase [Solirubrobacterales bacterium]|jgi:succinate-semialdehyde dehydrogenase/glutarate-semialdehyde dehydrogenase
MAATTSALPRHLLLVGGASLPAAGDATFEVADPAGGGLLGTVADAAPVDGEAAVAAAAEALPAWRATAPRERAETLRNAYSLLLEREDELARLIALEAGKLLAEARAEVHYAASFLRWYAEEAVRVNGRLGPAEGGGFDVLTQPRPVGVCLIVTPWNFPLAMGTRKLGPALAAGCTAVVKPAEQTPLSMLALGAVLGEAGLPPGCVNVLPTARPAELVGPLLEDPRVAKLSFTGSTAVGVELQARSARRVLRTSLELGGNAPFIVRPDADLELAVEAALLAKLRNGGQACTAANRFLVDRRIAAPFAASLADRMRDLKPGPGLDPASQLGPVIDRAAQEKIQRLVDDARAAGAELLCGGEVPSGEGTFYPATVLADVPRQAAILEEEIFGPVAPIVPVDGDEEVIALANATDYGLAAYVISADVARARALARQLEVGMVAINRGLLSDASAPFGGVKLSGLGREGGPEGMHEYLDLQYLALPS